MRPLIPMAAATMLGVAATVAAAETCPWLDGKVAMQALLGMPAQVSVTRNPGAGPTGEKLASTTCHFKEAGPGIGQLSVVVMEFDVEANAVAAYERELKAQGNRARKSKLGASPSFFTMKRGFSAASYARKGKRVVYVSHVFGKRVNEAIARDPDGSVISTHEIARRVMAKL